MNIAIVGCGAMGSVYAGLLASAGHAVTAIARSAEQVQAIRNSGLRLEGASGDRVVHLQAHTEAPEQAMDLILIATKASGVAEAARQARRMMSSQTLVLTLQNGLGSAPQVAEVVGADRLAVGIAAAFGASMRGPAHAHHNSMAALRLGAHAGLPRASLQAIVQVLSGAGFNAEAVDDVLAMQWEKLICNVAYSALCGLTGLTVGEVMDDPELGAVSRAAATEAWEIARARGVAVAVDDPVAHVRAFGERVRPAKPSVLQDLEKRRPSEIGFINGAVPREAAACGRTAPVNATLTALVQHRELGFCQP